MDITWKLRGITVNPAFDSRFSVKQSPLQVGGGAVSELTILDASHRDRGEYICVANNEYGSDTLTFQLQVQGKSKAVSISVLSPREKKTRYRG